MQNVSKYNKPISLSLIFAICAISATRKEGSAKITRLEPLLQCIEGATSCQVLTEVDEAVEIASKLCDCITNMVYTRRGGKVKIDAVVQGLVRAVKETGSRATDVATDIIEKLSRLTSAVGDEAFRKHPSIRELERKGYGFYLNPNQMERIKTQLSRSLTEIAPQIDLFACSFATDEDLLPEEGNAAERLAIIDKILDALKEHGSDKHAIRLLTEGRGGDNDPGKWSAVDNNAFKSRGSAENGPSLAQKIDAFLKQLLGRLAEADKKKLSIAGLTEEKTLTDELIGLFIFDQLCNRSKRQHSAAYLGAAAHILLQMMEVYGKDITSVVNELKRYIYAFVNAVQSGCNSTALRNAMNACRNPLGRTSYTMLKASEIIDELEQIEKEILTWKDKVQIVIGPNMICDEIERAYRLPSIIRAACAHGLDVPKVSIIIRDTSNQDAVRVEDGIIRFREGHGEISLPNDPGKSFFRFIGHPLARCLTELTRVNVNSLLKFLNGQASKSRDGINSEKENVQLRGNSMRSEDKEPAQPARPYRRRGRRGKGKTNNATSSNLGLRSESPSMVNTPTEPTATPHVWGDDPVIRTHSASGSSVSDARPRWADIVPGSCGNKSDASESSDLGIEVNDIWP